ncbi:MAG: hypothetical protein K6B41_00450 [Butyrivibrio sp.]|nr:hypothetical protein [Butyrivibrio sp.]
MASNSIDQVFKMAEALSAKLHEYGNQKGLEEKVAEAMMNATDPDQKFKADIAVKLSTVMSMIDMLVKYVNKPVKQEGVLQRKLDGSVMLDETLVPVGSIVEYWENDGWKAGKIMKNSQTKQCQIVDLTNGKVVVEKIEQLKGRIR